MLSRPYTFDIIISDFGREAAIEYLRSAAIIEKKIVHSQLMEPNAEFFDEYRRIMFVLVADLAYFKKAQIERYLDRGHLDSEILLGVGELEIPGDIRERITRSIVEQVSVALNRRYEAIRIVIPCNTLAPLGSYLGDLLRNADATRALIEEQMGTRLDATALLRLRSAEIRVCTIPPIVLDEVYRKYGPRATLLVLGTTSTLRIYASETAKLGAGREYVVCELSQAEQDLINQSIVAAIGGDASDVRRMKQKIETEIVRPRREAIGDLVVVEACTDFDLGLGMDTLEVFARRLVYDAYGVDIESRAEE